MENPKFTVSSSHWHECQMYLSHNYASALKDYGYTTLNGTVHIEFMDKSLAQRFAQFFGSRVKALTDLNFTP